MSDVLDVLAWTASRAIFRFRVSSSSEGFAGVKKWKCDTAACDAELQVTHSNKSRFLRRKGILSIRFLFKAAKRKNSPW